MHKNVFILPVSFTGSYTGDKPIWYNLILQKNVSDFFKIIRTMRSTKQVFVSSSLKALWKIFNNLIQNSKT